MKFPHRESQGRSGCGQASSTRKGLPVEVKPRPTRHKAQGGHRLSNTMTAHDRAFAALLLAGAFILGFAGAVNV